VENTNIDNGYGSLTLSGYAIKIPAFSDIKIGDWNAHYKNGTLGKEVSFSRGKPQHYIEYYPDGTILLEGTYTNGKPSGHWIGHHPNGKVSVRNDFGVSSQEPITQDIFDLNGILMIHYDSRTNLVTDYRKKTEPNQSLDVESRHVVRRQGDAADGRICV